MSSNISFRPVQGLSQNISTAPYAEGSVYFTTDTGKIYIDTRDSDGKELNKYPVGGSGAAILYGNAPTLIADTNDHYVFNKDYLEESVVPKPDDLIINSDGIFYKIIYLDDDNVYCNIIAVSGGSSGGVGGGSGTQGSTARLDRVTESYIYKRYGDDCTIKFEITAKDNEDEIVPNPGTYSIQINGVIVKQNITAKQGINETPNIQEYLNLGNNTIRIIASLDIGGSSNVSVSKQWTVMTQSLSLSWTANEKEPYDITEPVTFKWEVVGMEKYISKIMIDDQEYLIKEIDSQSAWTIPTSNFITYGLQHGAHKVTIWAEGTMEEAIITTEKISKTFIFVDNNNTNPIISCPMYDFTLTQYETTRIPLIIYDSNQNNGKISFPVQLYEDGVKKDEWKEIDNLSLNYWNYSSSETGVKNLRISCGTAELNLVVNIKVLNIGVTEVTANRVFKLKASEISSNEMLKNWKSVYGEDKIINLSFSDNFDWLNGGLQADDEGNPYIGVRAGTTMTINYKPFETGVTSNNGKAFKIIFKATNCRDYDAKVLECYDYNETSKTGIGLEIKAQNALYATGSININTPLCEDIRTEYEIDISSLGAGTTERPETFIVPWINGVPAGVKRYSPKAPNVQQSKAQNITIGSADCDVYVYLVKYYDNHLTNTEHLNNFIMDAPNATEMLNRFNRNDILDGNGQISYLKLSEQNPEVAVHLYEVSNVPTSKTDVTGVNYYQYKNNKLMLSAENAKLRAQGTSSMAYGIAAFNFDLNIEGATVKDENGEEITDGWSMDDKAIPVTYFNTKVNVASSEGANNAINQEWYNMFQPYKCEWRQTVRDDGKLHRDTMQFKPGVVFIKDNNTTITAGGNGDNVFKDTLGYTDKPYYKLYSVGCMGNSKKNTEVFHNIENKQECCIEISDNQFPQQWLTNSNITYDSTKEAFVSDAYIEVTFTTSKPYKPNMYYIVDQNVGYKLDNSDTQQTGVKYYEKIIKTMHEFRYAPTNKEAFETAVQNWLTFVKWIAEHDVSPQHPINHPNGYTNNPLVNENGEKIKVELEAAVINWTSKSYGENLQPVTIYEKATYEKDTEKYRVHKFLAECGEHLIMDSIIYHYLFIERHTMIDNVAKNTFWSTEDGQHWQLVKDYDNDTADGIDNSGVFTFDYGCEPDDLQSDGKTSVFNASESVWFKVCHHLYDANAAMFNYLENTKVEIDDNTKAGAWDSTAYLKAFEKFQGCIPERVWIEDYDRKYFRPYRVYGDETYFPRLAGGLKTLQRTRFEKYQELYMASKYGSTLCANSRIDFRANANSEDEALKLPVKMYADCYIQTSFGSGGEPVKNNKQRVRRGETLTLDTGIHNATDATCYLFTSQLYQEIGDLTPFQIKNFNGSGATKLRKLILGKKGGTMDVISYKKVAEPNETEFNTGKYFIVSKDENEGIEIFESATGTFDSETSYYIQEITKNQDSSNALLQKVSLENNILLEELTAQGLTNVNSELDLSKQKNLLLVDTIGSTFTDIIFADGAMIKTATLESPRGLTMKDLTKLEEFSINSGDYLQRLNLRNIDNVLGDNSENKALNRSKDLITKAQNSLNYQILDVNWKIDTRKDEITITNDSQGNIATATIKVLEKLKNANPSGDSETKIDRKDALSGELLITRDAVDNQNTAFKIYDTYAQEDMFPNLNIEFEGSAKLINVNIIRDPSGIGDNINTDGENKTVWTRKGYDGLKIGDKENKFFEKGPNGTILDENGDINEEVKTRSLTGEYVYTFDSWYVNGVSKKTTDFWTAIEDLTIKTTDINIQAVFSRELRKYNIIFKDSDNTTNYKTIEVEYGQAIGEQFFVPDKSSDNLDFDKRYDFKGWSLDKNASDGMDLTKQIVRSDMTLYPIFKEVNVYDVATSDDFFDYEEITIDNEKGYEIKVKKQYWADKDSKLSELKGKVTIPAMYNKLPVLKIGNNSNSSAGFALSQSITHVFFQTGSKIKHLDSYAFYLCTELKYFDFIDSLTTIGLQAFHGTQIQLSSQVFGNKNLQVIGGLAFAKSVNSPKIISENNDNTIYFSSSLKELGIQAFRDTIIVNSEGEEIESSSLQIQIGDENNFSNLEKVGTAANATNNGIFSNPPVCQINWYTKLPQSATKPIEDVLEEDAGRNLNRIAVNVINSMIEGGTVNA